jgi:hypothetical protein
VTPEAERHPVDLACGIALSVVVGLDFFTAKSLSLVAYVQPQLVSWTQLVEQGLSWIGLACVAAVLATWGLLFRAQHRRLTLAVIALQTVGLLLDVAALLTSTLFGKEAAALYLLLEAACVLASTVLLFGVWYTVLDHHGRMLRRAGQPARQVLVFPQDIVAYPGHADWIPGYLDYLFLSFSTSSTLGPTETLPLTRPVKVLMILQVSISLLVLVVLAARAIGLID